MTHELDSSVRRMVTEVVRALVDRPEDVIVEMVSDSAGAAYRVELHPTDIGKVIGTNGRTIRALRSIVGANAAKLKRSFSLDVVQASS